uniref:Uncharacterized protein n=1 Tax=Candidatus Kentrum sp. FM TaxID=2126340 RepID=A0A450SGR5_9GAMM|nr:MAG: hypothetical protein BECKFM1743A_GA0114220_101006 [Candidatus Kentron sp. FM]VFJ59385.1 MAG: hypothetical protein BECKFM1743C_GA0114222_102452 [Candidatus Kentron sp. FM]VFK22542.1 MAG: hypothetical protein BECKFM1743B_GA0114221_108672 [Candidatus Kentron sp. FM]
MAGWWIRGDCRKRIYRHLLSLSLFHRGFPKIIRVHDRKNSHIERNYLPYTTIRRFLVFLVRFSCSHPHKVLVRYRSYRAFPIASSDSDSDSDSERTTTPVAAWLHCITIRRFLVFLVRFSCSHFHKVLVRYRYRDSLSLSILSGFFDSE